MLDLSVKFHGLKVDRYIRERCKLSRLDAECLAEFRMPSSAGLRGFMNMPVLIPFMPYQPVDLTPHFRYSSLNSGQP